MTKDYKSNIETLFFKKTRYPRILFIDEKIDKLRGQSGKITAPYIIMEVGGEVGIANCNDYECLGLLIEITKDERWEYIKDNVSQLNELNNRSNNPIMVSSKDDNFTYLFQEIKSNIELRGWIQSKEHIWRDRLEDLREKVRGEPMEEKDGE